MAKHCEKDVKHTCHVKLLISHLNSDTLFIKHIVIWSQETMINGKMQLINKLYVTNYISSVCVAELYS